MGLRGSEEGYINRSLTIRTVHQRLFGWTNQEGWDGPRCVVRRVERRDIYMVLVWRSKGKRQSWKT